MSRKKREKATLLNFFRTIECNAILFGNIHFCPAFSLSLSLCSSLCTYTIFSMLINRDLFRHFFAEVDYVMICSCHSIFIRFQIHIFCCCLYSDSLSAPSTPGPRQMSDFLYTYKLPANQINNNQLTAYIKFPVYID